MKAPRERPGKSESARRCRSVGVDSLTAWTAARQAPPVHEFSRQEHCIGLPVSSSRGFFLTPGLNSHLSPALADSLPPSATWEVRLCPVRPQSGSRMEGGAGRGQERGLGRTQGSGIAGTPMGTETVGRFRKRASSVSRAGCRLTGQLMVWSALLAG